MLKVCLLLVSLTFLSATSFKETIVNTEYKFKIPEIKQTITYGDIPASKIKDILGYRESKNNYFAVNTYGCLGKYQFTPSTLKVLGFNKKDIKEFTKCVKIDTTIHGIIYKYDTTLQERAMDSLLARNYRWLKSNHLLRYHNKVINNIKITIPNMLCAMHLLGGESLKDFLKNQGSMAEYVKVTKYGQRIHIRKYDGYKTSIKDYLKLIKDDR